MSDYKFQKPDTNAAELDAYFRGIGADCKALHRTDGHDRLVTFRGLHYVVEYKYRVAHLTPAETKRREEIECVGGMYYVLLTIVDCQAMIDGTRSDEEWKAIGR